MIRSKLFLAADRAIRERETNNVSIINILDDITAESYPVFIARVTIVGFIIKDTEDPDKPSLILKLVNNNQQLEMHPLKIDFRGKNKTRAIIQLGILPVPEPGQFHFILEDSNGVEIDRYSINMKLREEIKIISE